MQVLLMADTHVPRRARDLPPALWAAVADADLVIHAGDWVDAALLDRLEDRSRRLLACWGNNDGPNCAHACRRWDGPTSKASASPWCTRPALRTGGNGAVMPRSPMSTCCASATATSPGTAPRPQGCAC